jgi:hypothetical protein
MDIPFTIAVAHYYPFFPFLPISPSLLIDMKMVAYWSQIRKNSVKRLTRLGYVRIALTICCL